MATKAAKTITINSTKYTLANALGMSAGKLQLKAGDVVLDEVTLDADPKAIIVKLTAPDDGNNYPDFTSTVGWTVEGWYKPDGTAYTGSSSDLFALIRQGYTLIADIALQGALYQHWIMQLVSFDNAADEWKMNFAIIHDLAGDFYFDYLKFYDNLDVLPTSIAQVYHKRFAWN